MTMINPSNPTTAAERYAESLTNSLSLGLDRGGSLTFINSQSGTSVTGTFAAGSVATTDRKDIVSFSPAAVASLESAKIALALISVGKGDPTSAALSKGAAQAGAGPAANPTPITGFDEPSSAADAFNAQFAEEAADGPAGRFYKSTDPEKLASIMSQDEYASFKAAFDNQTLIIQSASDAPGVDFTGSVTTTFSGGAGHGMSMGGNGNVDVTQLLTTAKYALTAYDPFFGPTVISWGGPPNQTASPSVSV